MNSYEIKQLNLFEEPKKQESREYITPYKGKIDSQANKLNSDMGSFVAFDTETTGLSPIRDELIEISAIKYEDGIPTFVFSSLIKPKCIIPEFITSLTGIDNKMVENAPDVKDVLAAFSKFSKGQTLVAHNAEFDYGFLKQNSDEFKNVKLVDTVKLSRKIAPFLPNHKLNTMARYIGIKEDGFHRAEFDCECCAKIYLKYIKEYMPNQF